MQDRPIINKKSSKLALLRTSSDFSVDDNRSPQHKLYDSGLTFLRRKEDHLEKLAQAMLDDEH